MTKDEWKKWEKYVDDMVGEDIFKSLLHMFVNIKKDECTWWTNERMEFWINELWAQYKLGKEGKTAPTRKPIKHGDSESKRDYLEDIFFRFPVGKYTGQ